MGPGSVGRRRCGTRSPGGSVETPITASNTVAWMDAHTVNTRQNKVDNICNAHCNVRYRHRLFCSAAFSMSSSLASSGTERHPELQTVTTVIVPNTAASAHDPTASDAVAESANRNASLFPFSRRPIVTQKAERRRSVGFPRACKTKRGGHCNSSRERARSRSGRGSWQAALDQRWQRHRSPPPQLVNLSGTSVNRSRGFKRFQAPCCALDPRRASQ